MEQIGGTGNYKGAQNKMNKSFQDSGMNEILQRNFNKAAIWESVVPEQIETGLILHSKWRLLKARIFQENHLNYL